MYVKVCRYFDVFNIVLCVSYVAYLSVFWSGTRSPVFRTFPSGTRGTPRQHIEAIVESEEIAILLEGLHKSTSELQPTWADGAIVLVDVRDEEEARSLSAPQASGRIQM